MIRLFPIIMMVQAFCLYHAFENKSEHKWYWIIFFLPFIGSAIYLYHHFYSRRKIENLTEGIKKTFVSNYTIDQLEKKVKFSDTYANKLELAEEHIHVGNLDRGIAILESCLDGNYQNDPALITSLIQAYYLNQNYEQVIKYGDKLKDTKEFKNSDEMVAYAWANYHTGHVSEAEALFKIMDSRFCNYEQRLEYAYFLQDAKNNNVAKVLTEELMDEINAMDSYERRINKAVIGKIKQLDRSLG